MDMTDEQLNNFIKHYDNLLSKATKIIYNFEKEDPEIYLLRYLKVLPKSEKALALLGLYYHRYMKTISKPDKSLRKYYFNSAIETYTKLLEYHPNHNFYYSYKGMNSNDSILYKFSENERKIITKQKIKTLVFDFKIYALSYVNVQNWSKAIYFYKEILKIKPDDKFSIEQLFLCSLKEENENSLDAYINRSQN